MKVIVLLIIVITISSCGWKPKVSCNVDDIRNIAEDCIEQPELAISKEF
tara:strand:- start:1969 stop:2115 length:147 start_codon:yes stop_codon:yes gene_type:complete